MKKILVLVLLLITFMSGCGSPKGTAITVDLSNLTPSQVVETYSRVLHQAIIQQLKLASPMKLATSILTPQIHTSKTSKS
ncbi:MAG TPA: hypothetical protein VN456_06645 [Desulfosporosinus sp.]|nr:hypothetical protein [Desulfosporosinus sp.]